ncbi:MAG: type II toxin-antitoxin system RelE/ParE family toxin [Clostridia bacterium]|nr:type II toxin-antitoxin system RelE/ParE family toxin [Clostridia bacterium]
MDYLKAKKYKVIWLNSFKQELSHIYRYLSVKFNNDLIIKRFHKKVLNQLFYLSYYSNIYQKIEHPKNIRRVTVDKYVVLYTIDDIQKNVYILHNFHGNQDYFNKL